jgi:hypothetical protein
MSRARDVAADFAQLQREYRNMEQNRKAYTEESQNIVDRISSGDLSNKPGFIRVSLHPTMTNAELEIIISAVNDIANNHNEWSQDYSYDNKTNEFTHKTANIDFKNRIEKWFEL